MCGHKQLHTGREPGGVVFRLAQSGPRSLPVHIVITVLKQARQWGGQTNQPCPAYGPTAAPRPLHQEVHPGLAGRKGGKKNRAEFQVVERPEGLGQLSDDVVATAFRK